MARSTESSRFIGWKITGVTVIFIIGLFIGRKFRETNGSIVDSVPTAFNPGPPAPQRGPQTHVAKKPVRNTSTRGNAIAILPPSQTSVAWESSEFTIEGMHFVVVRNGGMTLGPRHGEQNQSGITSVSEERFGFFADDYWIMATELTQSSYQRIVGKNPSMEKRPSYPVTNVTAADATAFVRAMNRRHSDCFFSLPTVDQLEYAARSDVATDCPFPVPIADLGGYQQAFEKFERGDSEFLKRFVSRYVHFNESEADAVGQRLPNHLGIYDLSGNVWDLCLRESSHPPRMWPIVGGAFSSTNIWGVSSAIQDFEYDDVARESIGFRLVVVPR